MQEPPPSKRKVRLTTRGLGTKTIVKVSGKIKIVMDPDIRKPTCELASARLSSECGYLVRTMAPLQLKKWKNISAADKKAIMECLLVNLILILLITIF